MNEAYASMVDAFFGEDAILSTVHCLVTHNRENTTDCIGHVAVRCLNSAITPLFVDNACAFFRSDRTLVIPTKNMTAPQLHSLHHLLTTALEQNATCQYEQRSGETSTSVTLPPTCVATARPAHVIAAVHTLLTRGTRNVPALQAADIPNVVLQRLVASTSISPTEIAYARELARKWAQAEGRGKGGVKS